MYTFCQSYYFVADMPNVLNCMYQLAQKELISVDLRLQIERFKHTFNKVVNHANFTVHQDDLLRILEYDGWYQMHINLIIFIFRNVSID